MSAPAVTVSADASVGAILQLIEERRISAVPVVNGDDLVGIVSTTDIVAATAREGEQAWSAAELMSSPVVIARPDEPLDSAAWRLVAARVHRLVVTDGDRPMGILSIRDVLEEVKNRRIADPIRSVMSSPVESIPIGATVEEAITRLAAASVHGLVVVDGLSPVGVFTHTEALAARRLPARLRTGPVEEVMSYETICLDASTPIFRASAYATAMNVRRILVVESKHLVGVLSCMDLVAVLARAPAD